MVPNNYIQCCSSSLIKWDSWCCKANPSRLYSVAKVVLTFESVGEICKCGNSNESY